MTNHLRLKGYYLNDDEDLKITFEHLEFIEPAGAIVFLNAMDKIKESKTQYEIEPINHLRQSRSAISYGETMGIFQLIGISDATSHTSGSTYLAPTKVGIREVYRELDENGIPLGLYFEQISGRIVNKALGLVEYNIEEKINDLFIFVVREMVRNIFDHAQTPHYYYALQAYKTTNYVEVVIADVGVGLRATVPFSEEEIWHEQNTDEEAIKKALIPGLSAFSNHSYAPEEYKNSGFGLALVKSIIQRTGGIFSIASGTKSITYGSAEKVVQDCDVKGTIVRMKIGLDKLGNVNFDEVLKEAEIEAIGEGFKQAPSNASKTVKSKYI